MNPEKNGEYELLKKIIIQKSDNKFTFIDGGSHEGNHLSKAYLLLKKYGISNYQFFSIEPNIALHTKLKKLDFEFNIITDALSNVKGESYLFHNEDDIYSGQSSLYRTYYHKNKYKVKTTTIDIIMEKFGIKVM